MKYREAKFKCRCVVGDKCDSMSVKDFGDKDAMFDVKRGRKYYGVVLNEKDIVKLIKFLGIIIKQKR